MYKRQGRDPTGEYIYLDREPFEIVGVLDEKGENLGEGVDRMIFVPITVAQKRRGTNKVDEVYIKAVDQESIPMVQLTLERIFAVSYTHLDVYKRQRK